MGDGANDVSMIQTAHVGVGISGQEGLQAVNSADYAVAQFRFLTVLLLVHGRWNYKRVSKVILYSFYKNVALVMCLFLFNFYNGMSGTTLFESMAMAGYNFFLALPIMVVGTMEEDVGAAVAMANPHLYRVGQWRLELDGGRFFIWILNAVLHATQVFFMTLPFVPDGFESSRGDGQCDGCVDPCHLGEGVKE